MRIYDMKKYVIFFIFLSFSIRSFALETDAKFAILMDAETGQVLYEKNAYEKMPPSSMSKIMTAFIVFDQLKKAF